MSCDDCDHGWRQATPAYTESRFPYPDDATDEQRAAVDQQRRMYDSWVFPCPECRPSQFQLWAGGHLASGHRAADCETCVEAFGEKGARRMDRAAQPTTASL